MTPIFLGHLSRLGSEAKELLTSAGPAAQERRQGERPW